MEFHPNELTILFNPESDQAKKIKAYAHSISNNVNEIDLTKTRLTTTLWKEIINMLKLDPSEIINQAHPYYGLKVEGNSFTMDGWLNVLLNTPTLLKGPIAISKKNAVLCSNSTDILKLGISNNSPSKRLPHLSKD